MHDFIVSAVFLLMVLPLASAILHESSHLLAGLLLGVKLSAAIVVDLGTASIFGRVLWKDAHWKLKFLSINGRGNREGLGQAIVKLAGPMATLLQGSLLVLISFLLSGEYQIALLISALFCCYVAYDNLRLGSGKDGAGVYRLIKQANPVLAKKIKLRLGGPNDTNRSVTGEMGESVRGLTRHQAKILATLYLGMAKTAVILSGLTILLLAWFLGRR